MNSAKRPYLDKSHPETYKAMVKVAADVLSTEQISAIEWSVILINSFNRLSIASGHPPSEKSYAAEEAAAT